MLNLVGRDEVVQAEEARARAEALEGYVRVTVRSLSEERGVSMRMRGGERWGGHTHPPLPWVKTKEKGANKTNAP